MEKISLGLVVERREIANKWQPYRWMPVEVIPHGPEAETWQVLYEGQGVTRWYAGCLPIELHRGETAAYKMNLSNDPPVVYCVLRQPGGPGSEAPVKPFRLTVSPVEAEEFLVSGDEIVEGVPMPPEVLSWVADFVARHHVDVPFVKRQRKSGTAEADTGPRLPAHSGGTGEEHE